MKTFKVTGNAVNLCIKAENKEAAAHILRAPLTEVIRHLTGVWFERK